MPKSGFAVAIGADVQHEKELVRYIHLNPLRTKFMSDYRMHKKFRYSGHCALMGQCHFEWQGTGDVMAQLGPKLSGGDDAPKM